MACNMNRRASVVEWPLHANFRWSIFRCNYGSSLLHENPSMTFASVQVSAIGWRSLFISLGGFTFRIGVTMKDFRSDGMYPSLRDWLFRMTGANLCAKSLSCLFGILSGPTAFATLSDDRDRNTSSLETKSSCGTRLGAESLVKGVKWSVRLTKKSLILFASNLGFIVSPRNRWYHSC